MTALELQALLPLGILAGGIIVTMLQIAFRRHRGLTVSLTLVTLLGAAVGTGFTGQLPLSVTPLLRADGYALLFCVLFCLAAVVTALLSTGYLNQRGDQPEEFFLLLMLSTLGACVLAYATHLAALLLGMELLSVALYALIAYPDKAALPLEAAIKYLVLSGAASATMLFGFALLYAATGTLAFSEMATQLSSTSASESLLLVAAVMVFAGLAFKLSLVPFHLWTPDVYEGAPSPVTGFLATVSKAAVFVVLLRWFLETDLFRYQTLVQSTALVAILSMLGGNLLALLQSNIKRLLAYSSIAHMGYLLIIFMVASNPAHRDLAREAAVFYLVAYTATTLAAFALLAQLGTGQAGREQCQLQDVSGLFWRHPLVATLMLVALLSLAGIPLTAGFLAKFYLVGAAVSGYHWLLLASLVLGSGIGIYYYLRVVFFMSRRPGEHDASPIVAGGWQPRAINCLLIVAILWLGTLPQPLLEYLRAILSM